jgi:hypothetical protein
MGFWSALGEGLEDYAVKRLASKQGQHHGGLGKLLLEPLIHREIPTPTTPTKGWIGRWQPLPRASSSHQCQRWTGAWKAAPISA